MPRYMIRRFVPFAASLLSLGALAACNSNPPSPDASASADAEVPDASSTPMADPLASHDPGPGMPPDPSATDDQPRPLMKAQVILERQGFAPGIIDGKMGLSTRNAIAGFQEANGLKATGELDDPTGAALDRWNMIAATRVVTIPADFAAESFAPLPKDPAEQAKLKRLGYQSIDEKLAERFHTTVQTLRDLNPGVGANPAAGSPAASPSPTGSATPPPPMFAAGQQIRVPNVGADALDPSAVDKPDWLETLRSLGVGTSQPDAAKIVVSKAKGTLKAYDEGGKLVALFTVTTGSSHDPLPLGEWKINGTSYNPQFSYDPSLFWDVPDSKGEHLLPPGPNGPVGVVWIDLSKEHYGIHGTPEPETIGRAESHGCVRLTNWDAARLAQMVGTKTRVIFEA